MYLNPTPMFEWCLVRCGSKNIHQKYVCSTCVNILGSTVNILGGPIWSVENLENLHFDNE